MSFRPDKDFLERFDLDKSEFLFTTHKELDLFVTSLKQKSSTFQLDYPSEWGLLKSFDRAFWLRHIRNPEEEDWAPVTEMRTIKIDNGPGHPKKKEEMSVCACAFKDPRTTKSFR